MLGHARSTFRERGPAALLAAFGGRCFHEVDLVGARRVEGREVGGYKEKTGVVWELGADASVFSML
jgi:hypothetical protein